MAIQSWCKRGQEEKVNVEAELARVVLKQHYDSSWFLWMPDRRTMNIPVCIQADVLSRSIQTYPIFSLSMSKWRRRQPTPSFCLWASLVFECSHGLCGCCLPIKTYTLWLAKHSPIIDMPIEFRLLVNRYIRL